MSGSAQIAATGLEAFAAARERLRGVARHTPLQRSARLSERFGCEVWLKREDLQAVRSYKIRGAYNCMASLPRGALEAGAVCASAGNHAQGFAWSCKKLQVRGTVFMPVTTPGQKVQQTRMHGGDYIDVVLTGDTFDDCAAEAVKYTKIEGKVFVPPFDHEAVMAGQATVGMEILEDGPPPDFLFLPVGGGGLLAGVGRWMKEVAPEVQIIGVEPQGAASLRAALDAGAPVALPLIDPFVDGAAVKCIGKLTFPICRSVLSDLLLVPEGQVCSTILQLYGEEALVVEPAGALSVAALTQYREHIRGKRVVCVVSGGNNDITRMQEIQERALQFEGLKHYFLIRFAQRPGALRTFVNEVLGPSDDITRFEYMKKNHRDTGPALVGIQLHQADDHPGLLDRLRRSGFSFTELKQEDELFRHLI